MNHTTNLNGVSTDLPLIYHWEIYFEGELVGCYVGKAKNGARRPFNDYRKNVTRLLAGLPYRKSKPNKWRRVHRALAEAVRSGYEINLTLLCNIQPGESIDAVERAMIVKHNSLGPNSWQLNGI